VFIAILLNTLLLLAALGVVIQAAVAAALVGIGLVLRLYQVLPGTP
jgi:hypothetical protein